jgi:hypothetical protein
MRNILTSSLLVFCLTFTVDAAVPLATDCTPDRESLQALVPTLAEAAADPELKRLEAEMYESHMTFRASLSGLSQEERAFKIAVRHRLISEEEIADIMEGWSLFDMNRDYLPDDGLDLTPANDPDVDTIMTTGWHTWYGGMGYNLVSYGAPFQGNHSSEKAHRRLTPAANGRPREMMGFISFSATQWAICYKYFDGYSAHGNKSPGQVLDVVYVTNQRIEDLRVEVMVNDKVCFLWKQYTASGPKAMQLAWNGADYRNHFGGTAPYAVSDPYSVVMDADIHISTQSGLPGYVWTDGHVKTAQEPWGSKIYFRFWTGSGFSLYSNVIVYSDTCPGGNCAYRQILSVYIEYGAGGRPHLYWSGLTQAGQQQGVAHIKWYGSIWWGDFAQVDITPARSNGSFSAEVIGIASWIASQGIWYPNARSFHTHYTANGYMGLTGQPNDPLGMHQVMPSQEVDSTGRGYIAVFDSAVGEVYLWKQRWFGWGGITGNGAERVSYDARTNWHPSLDRDTQDRISPMYIECTGTNDPNCTQSRIWSTAWE